MSMSKDREVTQTKEEQGNQSSEENIESVTWDEAAAKDKLFYPKIILLCIMYLPRFLFVRMPKRILVNSIEKILKKNGGIICYKERGKYGSNKAIVLIDRKYGNSEITVTIPKGLHNQIF